MTVTDTLHDPEDSHLDVSGEALLYEAMHEFWHPVAYASAANLWSIGSGWFTGRKITVP